MDKKEEKRISDHIKNLVPDRPHSPDCINLQIFGYHHDDCKCKCHKKQKDLMTAKLPLSKHLAKEKKGSSNSKEKKKACAV